MITGEECGDAAKAKVASASKQEDAHGVEVMEVGLIEELGAYQIETFKGDVETPGSYI